MPSSHGSIKIAFISKFQRFQLGFPGGSVVKNPPANVGDAGSTPNLGRSPGEWNRNPL